MGDVVIRRIRPADAPLLREVRLRSLATDPAAFASTHEREAGFGPEAWEEWAAESAAGDDWATLIAMRSEEPVGIVTGARDENERHVFHVFSMWVAPDARREGIGRRLLTDIEDWMSSSGGTVVELSVTNQAAAARQLYERAGYEPDGRVDESSHTGGLLEIGLRKRLRDERI
jgi:ribosomal protein S18 acetylase RimI-like enzyme